jgi:RNA polymerase sigma-70 factor (ECF subfamily)
LSPLLDAVYAAFTLAHGDVDDAELRTEALWLGRLLTELLPNEPESLGLLSLMLFVAARVPANAGDTFIPLSLQDTTKWDERMISEAEDLLRAAGAVGRPGRFQIEAAIQAIHSARRRSSATNWGAIVTLYEGLIDVAPTTGAEVALAAALAQGGRPAEALILLDALNLKPIVSHQPYWATRAFVLSQLGRLAEARQAYDRAAGLTETARIRVWLLEQRHALPN